MIRRPKVDSHGNGRRIAFAAQDARAFFKARGGVVKYRLCGEARGHF